MIIMFRFVGFLLGATLSGYGAYYYLVDEYKAANNVVITDVMELHQSIQDLESHIATLEAKINEKK